MTTTPQQIAAISAQLSVDLATVTDDRIIELCLLYRSAPEALPTFPSLLDAEITRRFTAAEIAANDVMFSVIQNFNNTFNPLSNYQTRMYKLSTVDVNLRDDWFRDNATFFYDVLHNAEAAAWVVNNSEVMNYIAASPVAMATFVISDYAMDLALNSLVATTALSSYLTSILSLTTVNEVTTQKIMASILLLEGVNNNPEGLIIWVLAGTGQLWNDFATIDMVAANATAMQAISSSSLALSKVVFSSVLREAITGKNVIMQGVKNTMLATVQATWVKSSSVKQSLGNAIGALTNIDAGVVSPSGLVFASLGYAGGSTGGRSQLEHYNGKVAKASTGSSSNPANLSNLDGVSFNGAKFSGVTTYSSAYAELWIPPA